MATRKTGTKRKKELTIFADGSAPFRARLALLADRQSGGGDVERTVAAIIAAVRKEGDKAVLRYT